MWKSLMSTFVLSLSLITSLSAEDVFKYFPEDTLSVIRFDYQLLLQGQSQNIKAAFGKELTQNRLKLPEGLEYEKFLDITQPTYRVYFIPKEPIISEPDEKGERTLSIAAGYSSDEKSGVLIAKIKQRRHFMRYVIGGDLDAEIEINEKKSGIVEVTRDEKTRYFFFKKDWAFSSVLEEDLEHFLAHDSSKPADWVTAMSEREREEFTSGLCSCYIRLDTYFKLNRALFLMIFDFAEGLNENNLSGDLLGNYPVLKHLGIQSKEDNDAEKVIVKEILDLILSNTEKDLDSIKTLVGTFNFEQEKLVLNSRITYQKDSRFDQWLLKNIPALDWSLIEELPKDASVYYFHNVQNHYLKAKIAFLENYPKYQEQLKRAKKLSSYRDENQVSAIASAIFPTVDISQGVKKIDLYASQEPTKFLDNTLLTIKPALDENSSAAENTKDNTSEPRFVLTQKKPPAKVNPETNKTIDRDFLTSAYLGLSKRETRFYLEDDRIVSIAGTDQAQAKSILESLQSQDLLAESDANFVQSKKMFEDQTNFAILFKVSDLAKFSRRASALSAKTAIFAALIPQLEREDSYAGASLGVQPGEIRARIVIPYEHFHAKEFSSLMSIFGQ